MGANGLLCHVIKPRLSSFRLRLITSEELRCGSVVRQRATRRHFPTTAITTSATNHPYNLRTSGASFKRSHKVGRPFRYCDRERQNQIQLAEGCALLRNDMQHYETAAAAALKLLPTAVSSLATKGKGEEVVTSGEKESSSEQKRTVHYVNLYICPPPRHWNGAASVTRLLRQVASLLWETMTGWRSNAAASTVRLPKLQTDDKDCGPAESAFLRWLLSQTDVNSFRFRRKLYTQWALIGLALVLSLATVAMVLLTKVRLVLLACRSWPALRV
ncbi:uncharacterized protein LOC101846495 isoform X2 [Aplysia californica]|uniref:Uncharacterized protein LOC101846495 isoform X2 n=1 Tax=Aplysia californica TaxID=6500 RepID=A0ABM0JJM9_APLCA|nr:uncharacterized protein LOC101846495 isoform X2 [Aplysia californica]